MLGIKLATLLMLLLLSCQSLPIATAETESEIETVENEITEEYESVIESTPQVDLSVIEDKLNEVNTSLGVIVGVLMVIAFSGGMRNAS
jgi:hypothetical protein